MRRQTFTVFFASMIALGCDSNPPGTITGIVELHASGRAVGTATRNMVISIADSDRNTTVNANGYRFEDVPAGYYRLFISPTADVPEICRKHITGGLSSVRVVAGETTTANLPMYAVMPGECISLIGPVPL